MLVIALRCATRRAYAIRPYTMLFVAIVAFCHPFTRSPLHPLTGRELFCYTRRPYSDKRTNARRDLRTAYHTAFKEASDDTAD
jgi:hypothetical protein